MPMGAEGKCEHPYVGVRLVRLWLLLLFMLGGAIVWVVRCMCVHARAFVDPAPCTILFILVTHGIQTRPSHPHLHLIKNRYMVPSKDRTMCHLAGRIDVGRYGPNFNRVSLFFFW